MPVTTASKPRSEYRTDTNAVRLDPYYDNDCESFRLSRPLCNGEFYYRLAIRIEYLEASGAMPDDEIAEIGGKYLCSVYSVSVSEAGAKNCEQRVGEGFQEDSDYYVMKPSERDKWLCYELVSYGIAACLWHQCGTNRKTMLRLAMEQVRELAITYGFRMDESVNMIGNSGWDAQRGQIGF